MVPLSLAFLRIPFGLGAAAEGGGECRGLVILMKSKDTSCDCSQEAKYQGSKQAAQFAANKEKTDGPFCLPRGCTSLRNSSCI